MAPIIYTQRLQYPLVEEYTLNHTRRIKGYWSLLVLLYFYLDPLGLERSSPLGPTLREENNEDTDKARDRWMLNHRVIVVRTPNSADSSGVVTSNP